MQDYSNGIDFVLEGAGWADVDLLLPAAPYRISSVSYLSDALGDLVRIGLGLLKRADFLQWKLQHEPGETRVCFKLNSADEYLITALEFRDMFDKRPDHQGNKVAEGLIRVENLLEGIYSSSTRILNRYGKDGYHKNWSTYEFPMENYKILKAAWRP